VDNNSGTFYGSLLLNHLFYGSFLLYEMRCEGSFVKLSKLSGLVTARAAGISISTKAMRSIFFQREIS
jgi:hypothetical protein